MPVFTAPFKAIAVSAAQDLWELNTHASSRVRLREIRFGQYTDFGDAAAEILSVVFTRGYTVSGSGGSTITPLNVSGHTGALSAVTTIERNNTTVANTSGTDIFADTWNIQAPYLWMPPEDDMRFVFEVSTRFVVTITAPADSITMNGTLTFEEFGFSI
jgi:hypothetical protein